MNKPNNTHAEADTAAFENPYLMLCDEAANAVRRLESAAFLNEDIYPVESRLYANVAKKLQATVKSVIEWNDYPKAMKELTRLRAQLAASEASRAELVGALEALEARGRNELDQSATENGLDTCKLLAKARAALASARKVEGGEETLS